MTHAMLLEQNAQAPVLATYLSPNFSGSKAMHWNFQIVKCMDELVEQDDGREQWGQAAEFQERCQKK